MTLREQEDGVPVVSVSFSPNGRYVLASTIGNGASGPEGGPQQNGRILLYDATTGPDVHGIVVQGANCAGTGKVSRHYSGHMNRNYCIGSTFASKLVVSGSEDGLVYLWDLQKRTCVQRLGGHSSLSPPCVGENLRMTTPLVLRHCHRGGHQCYALPFGELFSRRHRSRVGKAGTGRSTAHRARHRRQPLHRLSTM